MNGAYQAELSLYIKWCYLFIFCGVNSPISISRSIRWKSTILCIPNNFLTLSIPANYSRDDFEANPVSRKYLNPVSRDNFGAHPVFRRQKRPYPASPKTQSGAPIFWYKQDNHILLIFEKWGYSSVSWKPSWSCYRWTLFRSYKTNCYSWFFKKGTCMLHEYRTWDGTSRFLVFPEFSLIRTFANSNKKLGPLRVRINGCVLYYIPDIPIFSKITKNLYYQ